MSADLSPMFLHETEAEVIATLVASPEQSMPWAAANIHPDDFFDKLIAALFRQLLVMQAEQEAITFATVCAAIQAKPELKFWQPAKISGLMTSGGPASNLPHLCAALREKRAMRALHDGITRIGATTLEAGTKSGDVIEGLQRVIEEAAKSRAAARPAPTMRELVMATVDRIQRRQQGEVEEVGFVTGLRALDREMGGLRPCATIVVAGEAKGGKSTLAINFLEALSVTHGQRCLFFGLEMPAIENVERMISGVGNIRAAAIRDGSLADADFDKLNAAAGKLAKAPIIFRDDVFDLAEMMAIAKQTKLAHPDLFAVFVDYAQLVGADRRDGDNREQEVAAVSVALRRLAMQEKLCVIVLSQLNDDGRLRESRKLGMDATTVIFIENDNEEGVKRLRLVQRGGRRVTVRVAYRGDFIKFDNLAEGQEYVTEAEPEPKKGRKAWKDYHK